MFHTAVTTFEFKRLITKRLLRVVDGPLTWTVHLLAGLIIITMTIAMIITITMTITVTVTVSLTITMTTITVNQ